jgi:protein-L-isoaspartate(D-aspartate) O-methyltransferase
MRDSEARRHLLATLSREILGQQVLGAIATMPREAFVMPEDEEPAHKNVSLPIGEGPTISQPLIVAIMLEACDLSLAERVLGVGTGSGDQAAPLSSPAVTVIRIDRILRAFAKHTEEVLEAQGCHNVTVNLAGETLCWSQKAPYDAIIVAAVALSISNALMQHLGLGERLVMPVGSAMRAAASPGATGQRWLRG